MATTGFYFAGLDNDEVNEVRCTLNRIAAELGYTAKRGKTTGAGNFAALMAVLAQDPVLVVDLLMPFHIEGIKENQ